MRIISEDAPAVRIQNEKFPSRSTATCRGSCKRFRAHGSHFTEKRPGGVVGDDFSIAGIGDIDAVFVPGDPTGFLSWPESGSFFSAGKLEKPLMVESLETVVARIGDEKDALGRTSQALGFGKFPLAAFENGRCFCRTPGAIFPFYRS